MNESFPPNPRFQRLLPDSLIRAAHTWPQKEALITEGARVTYGSLVQSVQKCASVLTTLGVRRGDRVIIYADNGLESVVALWAALWAGGVFVMVNPQTKSDKLKYLIDKSGARVLVTEEHLRPEFAPILANCPSLTGVLCAGEHLPASENATSAKMAGFWEAIADRTGLATPVFSIPTDVAALIFTSGTTGFPKGVTMTHQSMVFARDSIVEYLRLGDSERIVNVLPLAFDYGLYQLLMATALGATLVLERSFTYPGTVFAKMLQEQVTVFPGVPTIYSTLLSMHKGSRLCFPSVTRVTNTAAALPPDYVRSLREIFPNALIFAMYGLTECKRVSYLEPELIDVKRGSVGKAIPGTEMFLLSPEGTPVPPNQPGILHVRGPHVMAGYWGDPEATAKMLKPGSLPEERVLCAQDWFVMDDEGYFYFRGRSDDIIKTRGEKVSPVEVENVLYSLPTVKEAAVIGVSDEKLGQAIKAFLVLEKDSELSAKEIQRHCAARLENFMVPQQIEFVAEFEKTTTGKIKKDVLR